MARQPNQRIQAEMEEKIKKAVELFSSIPALYNAYEIMKAENNEIAENFQRFCIFEFKDGIKPEELFKRRIIEVNRMNKI